MDNSRLTFNVLSQRTAESGLLSVEAVELIPNESLQLPDNGYAVRLGFLDPQTHEEQGCLTMNVAAAMELVEAVSEALLSIHALGTSR
jgi:hypothetical protein